MGTDDDTGAGGVRRGYVSLWPEPSNRCASVYFHFVHSDEQGVLWPVHEAGIQDATMIDRYGNPDLMADFAREYLNQHWALLPQGRLPRTLVEVMAALLVVVTAAESALKAFILRSGGDSPTIHDLVELYGRLGCDHQTAIESRFAACPLVEGLASVDADAPTIEHILSTCAHIYGDGRGARLEAKFYPEPTTMLPAGSNMRGANLVKGNTPYPTFMPHLVEAVIDRYDYFSGPERLRRRGAQIHERGPGSTSRGHGGWELTPSALGLAVIVVSQQESKDPAGGELRAFAAFKSHHPTGLHADWRHGGGSTLLFYDATGSQPRDGVEIIEGVECRVICNEAVGLHSRDRDRLADTLEAADSGQPPLGCPATPSEPHRVVKHLAQLRWCSPWRPRCSLLVSGVARPRCQPWPKSSPH